MARERNRSSVSLSGRRLGRLGLVFCLGLGGLLFAAGAAPAQTAEPSPQDPAQVPEGPVSEQPAPVCGNGTCESTETPASCPADCPPVCGDGACDAPEDPLSCAEDCPPVCGDGICNPDELVTCPTDCEPPEDCGDGVCSLEEDELNCPDDCAPGCGDGECDAAFETCDDCPTDCCPAADPASVCGNGICEPMGVPPEDDVTCPADCGVPAAEPTPPPPPPPVCGDGLCGLGESPCNCEPDCGPVGDPVACDCGDAFCNAAIGETCATCPEDCGLCVPPPGGTCGNAVCETELGESCASCVADCGECAVFDTSGEPYTPPDDPAEQSDGLDPAFQVHWQMEITAEDYPVPLEGDPTFETCTPLADAEGRREVEVRPAGSSSGVVLSQPDTWNFWAMGAKGTNGLTVVCWNRLVGAPSEATVGNMPDPRNGVGLYCAVDDGQGWAAEVEVEAGVPPVWILGMEVNAAGEPVVHYTVDSFGTLFNSGQPGDTEVEVTFHSNP